MSLKKPIHILYSEFCKMGRGRIFKRPKTFSLKISLHSTTNVCDGRMIFFKAKFHDNQILFIRE